MKRTHIGPLFGTTGLFISRPGDDVTAPNKSLLFDSRFGSLQVHAKGRFRLTRFYNVNDAMYYGSASFADLGYTPLFYSSFIYTNPNRVDVPPNSAYFPGSWGSSDNWGVSFNDMTLATQPKFTGSGCWLANNSTIQAKCAVDSDSELGIDVSFIVFKNREGG